MDKSDRPIARRTVVTALGTGAVALGAVAAPRDASAQGKRWQPSLEKQDGWMDMPGRHRLVFDSTSANGAGEALFFARNYIESNQSGYGLQPSQLATIIIVRHFATIFGYDDAMWAKYGATFSQMASFTDPKTKSAPGRNLYDAKDYGPTLANVGVTCSELAAKGVQFAVCGAATEKIAEAIAGATNADAAKVRDELASHLVTNGRIVPAGIVAVNRAQERGYALAYTG